MIPFKKIQMAPMWDSKITSLTQEEIMMPYEDVHIEDTQYQNGRVIGISEQSGNPFELFTENNNKSNNVKETILYGTLTRTTLSDTFFSEKNMENLQDMLRYRVYVASGGDFKISKQSNIELVIIMRAIYLQYSKNLSYMISEQIEELNTHVIDYILPNIMSEIRQWIYYSKDIEHLPVPLELPKNLSNKGSRVLSSIVGTF